MSSRSIETVDASVNRPAAMYNPVDNDNMGDQQSVCGLETDHENNREADHENNREDVLVINWLENDLENNREADHENNREADHENNREDVLVIN